MKVFLMSISLFALAFAMPQMGVRTATAGLCEAPSAQNLLPEDGNVVRYRALIEMSRGYISGVCVMRREGNEIKGSLVNEFGFSQLEFVCDGAGTEILSLSTLLDRRKIRKILARDLTVLLAGMAEGWDTYINEKKSIRYQFAPLEK